MAPTKWKDPMIQKSVANTNNVVFGAAGSCEFMSKKQFSFYIFFISFDPCKLLAWLKL